MSKIEKIATVLEQIASADLAGLQEFHSQMLATASDLGYEPAEGVLVEIEDEAQGRTVCENLHNALEEHRERQALAAGSEEPHMEGGKTGKKTAKSGGARARKPAKSEQPEADAETSAETKETETVATAPKKAAKKAAPKKAAKKAAKPAAKASAKKTAHAPKRVAVDETAKISWLAGDDLKAKEGSGRAERRALLKKHNGKTVATFLKAGGAVATLRTAIKENLVRLEGGKAAAA